MHRIQTITINEKTYFEKSKEFEIMGAASDFTFYPSIKNRFILEYFLNPDIELPADPVYQAKVTFQSGGMKNNV